jgi:hypothetical protein
MGYTLQPVQQTRNSGLAIASLVLSLVWFYGLGSLLAIILGAVALGQTKRDPGLKGQGWPSLGKLRADVTALTEKLAGELEVLIRRAPEQWHLFQPNWPSDPGYGV